MFISKLTHTIETYDPYGLHRLNGVKMVYILLVLFVCNSFTDIPQVYFNFFYVPITALGAEAAAEHIRDKYKAFILSITGAGIMIFFFGIFPSYPFFLLLFVFFTTFWLYSYALHRFQMMMPLIPIMLSLASYSTLYANNDTGLDIVLNNTLTTFFAMIIVLGCLILFPLSYYYRLWLRAFILLLQQTLNNLLTIVERQPIQFSLVQGHTQHMVTFANMLPRTLSTFSILKMTLLANELHLNSCVDKNPYSRLDDPSLNLVVHDLRDFIDAVKKEHPYDLGFNHDKNFTKLVKTWNHLCLKK